MKKVLVVYYSQSGQLKDIAESIMKPLYDKDNYQIDYFKIEPINDFPFPWTNDAFYDCMPESVTGDTIPVKAFDMEDDYDLVILAYQIWFLNLSIPFWSMLQEPKMKAFLKNKRVITVLGIRNMWVNAQTRLLNYFKENNINHVGKMVFADPNTNLISVITVLKFAVTGVKKPYKSLPPYGVGKEDFQRMPQFGELIHHAFERNKWDNLQSEFVKNKGVSIHFALRTTELAAGRIFNVWSSFVLKKGKSGNPDRKGRLVIYQFYLLFLIFFISPISSLIFKIINILFYPMVKKSLRKTALQLR